MFRTGKGVSGAGSKGGRLPFKIAYRIFWRAINQQRYLLSQPFIKRSPQLRLLLTLVSPRFYPATLRIFYTAAAYLNSEGQNSRTHGIKSWFRFASRDLPSVWGLRHRIFKKRPNTMWQNHFLLLFSLNNFIERISPLIDNIECQSGPSNWSNRNPDAGM